MRLFLENNSIFQQLIDNKNVIEQAAVIKALNKENIENIKIAEELAKYLQVRLNAISLLLMICLNIIII